MLTARPSSQTSSGPRIPNSTRGPYHFSALRVREELAAPVILGPLDYQGGSDVRGKGDFIRGSGSRGRRDVRHDRSECGPAARFVFRGGASLGWSTSRGGAILTS